MTPCSRNVLLGSMLAGLLSLLGTPATAQVPGKIAPGPEAADPPMAASGITLPTDRRATQVLEAAREMLKEKNWKSAAEAIQPLLNAREDGFVKVTTDGAGGKTTRLVSIRAEASRLLGTMPEAGRAEYQKLVGEDAATRLAQARQLGDPALLADVVQRYFYTTSGPEAANLLATHLLNHDEPLMASLYFDKLFGRVPADQQSPATLYRAALAFARSGDKQQSEAIWKLLAKKLEKDGGLKVGNEFLPIKKLREELERPAHPKQPGILDWPAFRGGVTRTEQAIGGAPFLEATWLFPTVCQARADVKNWNEDNIKQAINWLDQRGLPALPAFFPIAVNGKVIYRSYDGVWAHDLRKDGKIAWVSETDGGLRALLSDPNKKAYIEQWNQFYRQHGPLTAIFENSVIGTLSTDGTRVYAIDDLALPPHPYLLRNFAIGGQGQPNFGILTDQINRNSLKAYNLDTGKMVWELGGRFDRDDPAKGLKASDLAGSFFLSPPLPLNGKLYVLTERNQELRLACLAPKDQPDHPAPPTVVWTQTLALTRDKLLFDFNRRLHAAHLAYGNGILVCPTNAGAIMGVDLLTHSLVWVHSYRDGPAGNENPNPQALNRFGNLGQPQITLHTEWRNAAPAISDGKVVFTAPDASHISCLDLRDGALQWKVPRAANDFYFAGIVADKVLIVGKSYVKALNLADGKKAWEIADVGTPSGQGVASEGLYYLPLKAGPDKEPEVCTISVAKGQVVARAKSRKKEIPGNLIFYDGQVLSQTVDSIRSFPTIKAKLNLIDDRIKKTPNDPVGLIERGELRLDRGDLTGALVDLQTALKNNPPPEMLGKVHSKLYETMTEMFQRDFAGAEKHLEEYRALCKVEIPGNASATVRNQMEQEQQRRERMFGLLLAKRRESQGRLNDALKAYLDVATIGDGEMISMIDEPGTRVRPDVWTRGRIAGLFARATPEQRKVLEEEVAVRYKAAAEKNDIDSVRSFAGLFDTASAVGRQAKLELARRLMAKANGPNADELREAQLHLLQVRAVKETDPPAAGQAVALLAKLMMQKGLLPDALHYYKELGRDFAKVIISGNQTGADILNDVMTDKRFQPLLEGAKSPWQGKFTVSEVNGNFQMQPTFTLEGVGQLSPYFQTHRLVLDLNTQQLRVIDKLTNQETWKTGNLPSLQYLQHGQPNVRTTYSVQGSVVVVNLGHMVYGFDVVDQKKHWEYNLSAPGTNQTPSLGQVVRDSDGNLQLLYQDGWSLKLGQTGAVMPSHICLLPRNGLVALDPIKGTPLWIKSDINSTLIQIFGDEQYIYLVKVNADGTATGASQAVRASDGASIKVPDFREAYQKRVGQVGRNLLVRDEDGKNVILRIYDVLTGKDLWKKEFPLGSTALKSDDTDLGGIVDPEGNLFVIDIRTRQEVLQTTVKKEFLDKLQEVRLVADRDQFYLLLNKTADGNNNGVWVNVVHGMRCLNVNGTVYAFDRTTGKTKWYNAIANQMLVLDQFKDMPILIFTARSNEWVMQGGNRINQQMVKVQTILKSTGKLLFDKQTNANNNTFHALLADQQAGTIDLVSFNMKIRYAVEKPEGK